MKTQSETNISCSVVGYTDNGDFLEFNEEGPVYGPNGELELDPDNENCWATRPVFATCKNNCPGGELFSKIHRHPTSRMFLLRKYRVSQKKQRLVFRALFRG